MSNKATPTKAVTAPSLAELRALDPAEELTPEQAAEEAGKTRQTIYLWLRRKGKGKLKGRTDGLRGWRIRRSDLIAFLESSQHRAEDDGQERDDSATRGLILLLLETAQAGVRWRDANSLYAAQSAALAAGAAQRADFELAERCYADATTRHHELLELLRKLSAGDLDELRTAVVQGDCRIVLPVKGEHELVFSPARKDAQTLDSQAEH